MPTPEKSYTIGVKTRGATAATESYITFRNRTTNEYQIIKIASDETVCNIVKLTDDGTKTGTHTEYSNGSVIEIEASGHAFGGTTHTVDTSKGGKKISLTLVDVSTTNAPAVSF